MTTIGNIKINDILCVGDRSGYEVCLKLPSITKVIYNNPATIVLWEDKTKTVVMCNPENEYNKELGLLYCIAKKHFGNTGAFNEVLKKWCWDLEEAE